MIYIDPKPDPNCPYCFGSGWSDGTRVTTKPDPETGLRAFPKCICIRRQEELSVALDGSVSGSVEIDWIHNSVDELLGMLVVQSEAAGEWLCQAEETSNSEHRAIYFQQSQSHRKRASSIKTELLHRWLKKDEQEN